MGIQGERGQARYLVCERCNRRGPTYPTSQQARAAGKADGWARQYHGYGESFRCPDCRVRTRSEGPRSQLVTRIPADLHAKLRATAAAQDVGITRIVAEALMDKLDPPTPDPARPHVHTCIDCNARWDEEA